MLLRPPLRLKQAQGWKGTVMERMPCWKQAQGWKGTAMEAGTGMERKTARHGDAACGRDGKDPGDRNWAVTFVPMPMPKAVRRT